jgi:hypothetical protein
VKLTTDVPLPCIRIIDPDEIPDREIHVVNGVIEYERDPLNQQGEEAI